MSASPKFQNDKYKKSRGGHSRWLLLSCAECRHPISRYQKDGPGILKRLYLDRLFGSFKDKNLICQKCRTLLGTRVIYKKEQRPAYRLFAGAVSKSPAKE